MRGNKIRVGNVLLGLLSGVVISTFLIALTNLFIFYLEYRHPNTTYGWIKIIAGIIAVVAFVMVMKQFLSREKNKLSMYFLFSVAAATFCTIVAVYLMFSIVQPIVMSKEFQQILLSDAGIYVVSNLSYAYILLLLGVFISVFWLLVNQKVNYIRYISKEVKKIEIDGFGKTMEVRGNDELSELTTAMNTMSVKLKEKIDKEKQMEKQKNELISNVSHDLRTPLTSIIGYITLLKHNKCKDQELCNEYVEVVDRRLQGLHVMINELFEYTKMNASDFTLHCIPFDFLSILRHMAEEYAILYVKEGLTLEVRIEPEHSTLRIDVEKMTRVLQNLFENARKYAVKGSTVQLHVYETEKELVVEIKNETNQICPTDTNQLFERFYKGDVARSNADSSGLGLSIVKRIIELHEGNISATMTGKVICFQIKLKRS